MAFLNEYDKLNIIGKGGFATIWKVRHIKLGYVRAIKVSNEMVEDENDPAYQSFLNECKVLLKIGNGSHPNIVHIYQPRLIENRAIVEMDYVDGETLNEYIARKHFVPIDAVFRFADEIVRALAYCHYDIYKFLMDPNVDNIKSDPNDGRKYIIDKATEQELVAKYAVTHNDLHSNNVMRRNYDGSFVLLDFGLAIQNGKAVKSSSRRGGALEYMSPEKFDDSSVISTQSDVYSLGILLYEILAGRVPFLLDDKAYESNPTVAGFEMMKFHKETPPPPIEPLRREAFEKANPRQTYIKDYPEWLENVIMRCLAKNPAERYANAKEVFDDIQKHKSEKPSTRDDNSLLNDLERLKNDNQRLAAENEELYKRIENTSDTNMSLNDQIDSSDRYVAQLENEKSRLSSKIASLEQEFQNIKSEGNNDAQPVYIKRNPMGWMVATFLLIIVAVFFASGMVYFMLK